MSHKDDLLERDEPYCQYENCPCPKRELWLGEFTSEYVADACHIDHKKPNKLDNLVLMHPACHDKYDGRPAKDHLNQLGWEMFAIASGYKSCVSSRNKVNNELRATERRSVVTDIYKVALLDNIEYWDEQTSVFAKMLESIVKGLSKQESKLGLLVRYMFKVNPVGSVTIGCLVPFLNPFRAPHPSSYVKHCGLAGPSTERYKKGEKGGGSKFLRSVLYVLSDNMVRSKTSPYNPLYYDAKYKKQNDPRPVATRIKGGAIEQIPWNEQPKGRIHMHAKRIMGKRFLCDLQITSRLVFGLPASKPWITQQEGHNNYSPPSDRGWPTPEQIAKDLEKIIEQ